MFYLVFAVRLSSKSERRSCGIRFNGRIFSRSDIIEKYVKFAFEVCGVTLSHSPSDEDYCCTVRSSNSNSELVGTPFNGRISNRSDLIEQTLKFRRSLRGHRLTLRRIKTINSVLS